MTDKYLVNGELCIYEDVKLKAAKKGIPSTMLNFYIEKKISNRRYFKYKCK